MGYYIDPKNGESKESWLIEHAKVYPSMPSYEKVIGDGLVPLVLVDNGRFTACGIAYSKQEFEEFTDPRDNRPKLIFGANRNDVLDECPKVGGLLEP